MPNEEILTALKNAIEHGDSLESAIQIMVNSGYNINDVQESAKFISAGSINLQPEPEEELVMPEQKKSLASKLKFWGKNKDKNKIPKPSESMKLSSELTKKQKIIPAQTQTLPQQTPQIQQVQVPPIQQAVLQQQISQQQTRQMPVPQPVIQQTRQIPVPQPQQIQTQQVQQPVIQQTRQIPVQQVQQKPSILQQIARQVPMKISRQALRQTKPQLTAKQGKLTKDLKKIKPKGTSHKKEIILVIILLMLIGLLVATIMYKEIILGWFS